MKKVASVADTTSRWPWAVLVVGLVACTPAGQPRSSLAKSPPAAPVAAVEPSAPVAAASVEPPPLDPPAASVAQDADGPVDPVTVDVARDKHVFVVFGKAETDRVFVYFHGKCGDPLAFRSFARILKPLGTFVSFEGDVTCDGGRTKWSEDTGLLDVRVTKALDAVETARGAPLDKAHLVAIGYSAGALRAEWLATKFPDRYQRVILIGAPRPPRAGNLTKTDKILIMAGQFDLWMPLADATKDLMKTGRPARFIEIPGARHGDYGPKAEETMTEAFRWVLEDNG
jgi:predicted esterase